VVGHSHRHFYSPCKAHTRLDPILALTHEAAAVGQSEASTAAEAGEEAAELAALRVTVAEQEAALAALEQRLQQEATRRARQPSEVCATRHTSLALCASAIWCVIQGCG
jgi:small-conductance mechanosensitive channel